MAGRAGPAPFELQGTSKSGYDPDSDEEDSPGASSTCVLGFPDGRIRQSDVGDARISRIAGPPTLLEDLAASAPRSAFACPGCGEPLHNFLQLYCPLEGPTHEAYDRVLYVFGCLDRACQAKDQRSGRVRSFRAWKLNAEYLKTQLKDPEERQNAATAGSSAQSAQKRPEADFNPFSSTPSENPFGPSSDLGSLLFGGTSAQTTSSNPFSSRAEDEAEPQGVAPVIGPSPTSAPSPMANALSDALAALPYLSDSYYINAAYEPPPAPLQSTKDTTASNSDRHTTSSSRKAEAKADSEMKKHGSSAGEGDWSGEKWEVQKIRGVDDTFLRFQERIERGGSGQIIRYQSGGAPLRISPAPVDASSPCARCGSSRHFELQLMPALFPFLQKGIPKDLAAERGIEWATAWVNVCGNECREYLEGGKAEQGWMEEAVIVQWET